MEKIRQKVLFERNKRPMTSEFKSSGEHENKEKLICKKKKIYYQYYVDNKYISKKKGMTKIRELAREEYREKLLPVLESEMNALKRVLKTEQRLSGVYGRMHEGKQALFIPDYLSLEMRIRNFEKEEYVGLGFDENDHTEYYTNRGERVRSKSEKIIADELDKWGIPYKYEKPLALNINGKMKDFYPDFTAINKTTGDIKYIEHLGMMDHPNYFQNVLAKLDAYEKNGLLIGRDVVLLHESSFRPLNTRMIADYIEEFLT